jgi:hypothetical protein
MKTARNPRTGERMVLVDGVWKPVAAPLPWYHWSVIAGSSMEDRLRREQDPSWGRVKDRNPDPSLVDPPTFPD